MAEVDDVELARLRKAQTLIDELLRSPKTKRKTERAIKEIHPEFIASDDFDEPIREEIKAIGDKLDSFLERHKTSEEDAKLEAAFTQLRVDGGFTDEGIDKIKQIMVDRKVADPFAAAAYYEKHNPPPAPQKPSSFNGLGWGFGAKTDDEDAKLLFDDEDAWTDKQVMAHFNEQSK